MDSKYIIGILGSSTFICSLISGYNAHRARKLPPHKRQDLTYHSTFTGMFYGGLWGSIFGPFAIYHYVDTLDTIEGHINFQNK